MEKLKYGSAEVDKDQIIDELVSDKNLRSFFIDNDLDSDIIEANLSKLLNFKIEKDHCKGCEGLDKCKQDVMGYEPFIEYLEGKIKSSYGECQYYNVYRRRNNQSQLIDAMYMPKMVDEASLDDYDFKRGQNRMEIHNKLTNFITLYLNGEKVKGMYIWGQYQQGKTYTLAAMANELSKRNIKVIIAYYPDLVREFKSRIGDNSLEGQISKLKQIDVLMLDDIGGESQSAWVRDEILGPILQHRLLDEKPTFFTSNVSQKDLMTYMTLNQQSAEKMKAARVYARIHSLSDEYKM